MVIRRRIAWAIIASGLLCVALLGTATGGGLDPESNTDTFDPAADSHRVNEARRRNAIARQLDLIYLMQWENPYFAGEGPIRQPIGYESKQVSPSRWIYRPIYSEDVAPPANESLPEPGAANAPAAKPFGPSPADAAAGDFIPPKAAPNTPPARGPRKF